MSLRLLFVLNLLMVVFLRTITLAQELIQAPAAIQISSKVSDGKYDIAQIIKIAKQNNIKVVIITDRDIMRWQYGLWPLRNIIKKTEESNSIFKYGIRRYLSKIAKLQERNLDLVLIAGLESAPFYYWGGNLFSDHFAIANWHKHILVIGLDKVIDYKDLPVLGNKWALALPFKLKNIFNLCPILILLLGMLCLRKRQFDYRDLSGRQLAPYSHLWRNFGIFLIPVGLIFLLNNYPFCDFKFDQYHGDLGVIPYQNFIDYVNQRQGLTFWAHPEAEYIQKRDRINIETREYADDLVKTYDYTGFAIFYEGYNKVGIPGGIWDELLMEYCQGRRKMPVWAIGGLGFDRLGDLDRSLQDLRTVFLIPKLSKIEVFKALKEGKMYVIRGKDSSWFILDKFIVKDLTSAEAMMGEEITLEGKPQIEIKGGFLNIESQPLKIKLIKNGGIIKTIETTSPFDISYQDEDNIDGEKKYYRLEIVSRDMFLVANPIFVKQKINKQDDGF